MKGTIRATVKVTWRAANGERRCLQREKRFVPSTPARVRKAWVEATRAKLQKRVPAATDRAAVLGTLKADASRYYPLIKVLADWVTRRSEIRAWMPHLGDRYRHTISQEDVLRVRGIWRDAGAAARTINNRVSALKDLYRKLDGDDAPTPCDRVKFLKPPRTPVRRITADEVNRVLDALFLASLQRAGKIGRPGEHALADRARLMVMASTGRRPCEIERAQPSDVNLELRVWGIRDAKGGWSEGRYLNEEDLIAWQAFVDADAWGKFPDHFARRLRSAGWPADVDPYKVRHSIWMAASELGADLADIQAGCGHRHIQTTREHYVPVLRSRMQRLSELTDGRYGWQGRLAGQGSPTVTR